MVHYRIGGIGDLSTGNTNRSSGPPPPAGQQDADTALDGAHPDDHPSTPHAPAPRPTSPEHAHAHANAHDRGESSARPPRGSFPHEKLDAYRAALEGVAIAKRLAAEIPRGHRNLADHLLRAAANSVLLLAEGANRRGAPEKRQRFGESRGECAEVAAAADLLLVLEIGDAGEVQELKTLAGRVSAMLTRLIDRLHVS